MIRKFIYSVKNRIIKYLYLDKQIKRLRSSIELLNNDTKSKLNSLKNFRDFMPSQKDEEIIFLCDLIINNKFKRICEIGSFKGGSLFMLCQAGPPDAVIISVDINYPLERRLVHKRFAQKGQRIYCIQGDTSKYSTLRKTKKILRKRKLDFLFIDGDHSIMGVMNDFVKFAPLVKKGGVIVFHDICQDQMMRTGEESSSYVGGVPYFWEMIKKSGFGTREFIENNNQDGYGLGIVIKEY